MVTVLRSATSRWAVWAGVGQGRKPVLVQAFVAEAPVEGLDVGVLVRLARIDERRVDLRSLQPAKQSGHDELRTVIQDM